LSATAARAALIAYEPFDYDQTNAVAGLNGAGWPGSAWYVSAAGTDYRVVAPGLTYSNGVPLYTKGNCLYTTNIASWRTAARDLAGNLAGDAGTTNWLSFLAVWQADTSILSTSLSRQVLLTMVGTGGGNPVRFICGNGDTLSNQWCLNAGGAGTYYTGKQITKDEVLFVMIEIAYGAANDEYACWINPPVNVAPSYGAATRGTYAHGALSGISFNRGGGGSPAPGLQASFDEIRIGTFWNDVNTDEPVLVNTPANSAPANMEKGVALTPLLQASAFASADGLDTHAQSQFIINSLDGVEAWNIITTGLTSVTVPAGVLQPDTRYFWSVLYKGSHSVKWSLPSPLTWFDTTYVTPQNFVAYEGAAYAPATNGITGYAGGTGAWRANRAWEELEGVNFFFSIIDVVTPGLEYRDLAVTGNAFRTTAQISPEPQKGTNSQSRARRTLRRDGFARLLNDAGRIGTPGVTCWISGIVKAPAVIDENESYGFELCNALDGRSEYRYVFGKTFGTAFWSMRRYGSAGKFSTVAVQPNDTAFLVARLVYNDSHNLQVSLWVNPLVNTEPPENEIAATDSLTTTNVDVFAFDRIGIYATRANAESLTPAAGVDELRVGLSWNDVLPTSGIVVPNTPVNTLPAANATGVPVGGASVQGSLFSAAAGSLVASEARLTSAGGVQIAVSGTTELISLPGLMQDTRYTWQIRYKGSASDVWSVWSAATWFETEPNPPRLLAYDGAGYPAMASINGVAGGSGFAGAWQISTVSHSAVGVELPGLEYAGMMTTGGTFSVTGAATNVARANRTLARGDGMAHVLDGLKFGRASSTNWFAFLTSCADDGTNGGYGVYLYEGASFRQRIGKSPYGMYWALGGRVSGVSSTAAYTNALSLLVTRIIHASGAAADGQAHVWVNPDPLGAEPDAGSAVIASLTGTNMYFDTLAIVAESPSWVDGLGVTNYPPAPSAKIDEVSFSETWEMLFDVPEPALLGVPLLAWLVVRRRS